MRPLVSLLVLSVALGTLSACERIQVVNECNALATMVNLAVADVARQREDKAQRSAPKTYEKIGARYQSLARQLTLTHFEDKRTADDAKGAAEIFKRAGAASSEFAAALAKGDVPALERISGTLKAATESQRLQLLKLQARCVAP